MVYQDGALILSDENRQRKRVRLSRAREGTDHSKATGAIICFIGDYQSGTSLGLLSASLRIEIEPNNVPCAGDIAGYQSMFSLPRAGPGFTSE